jgi:hypothetical protein
MSDDNFAFQSYALKEVKIEKQILIMFSQLSEAFNI